MKKKRCISACTAAAILTVVLWGMGGCSTNAVLAPPHTPPGNTGSADVVVYSATPAGIMAAIEAAHMGKNVTLLEPSTHVGGMTASGLGATDVYDANTALGGLTAEFFHTVSSIYGAGNMADEKGTSYEPHVAEQAFLQMMAKEKGITIVLGAPLTGVSLAGTKIQTVTAGNGKTYSAKEFVDASYEGDLMAAAKVSFVVGREAASQYQELQAGVGKPVPMNAAVKVDPYVTPGDPASGLLPHVQSITLPPPGSADTSVMAYNYRLCVSTDPANQIPFAKPADYDPQEFEALGRFALAVIAKYPAAGITNFVIPGALPNNKFDVNNGGPFSTDDVDESAAYPNADAATRAQIAAEHKRYMQALMYFLITDSRIPSMVQQTIRTWGLCKDEFQDNGGWPRQLYVREARRMVGSYVLTENDVKMVTRVADSIGLGGYPMDSHITNRVVVKGEIENEGSYYGRIMAPYPISYGVLTPKVSEVTNLLVPVDVSASHAAYRSLRVEPTYMIMGQAAGAAASIAIDEDSTVQAVSYPALANQLVGDGQILY